MDVLFTNQVAGPGQVCQLELDAGVDRRIARVVARRSQAAARYLYVYVASMNPHQQRLELVTYPGAHHHAGLTSALRTLLGELRSDLLIDGMMARLGRLLPATLRRDIPASLSPAAAMTCAMHPMLRDLATLRPDLEVPPSLPDALIKVLATPQLRDALSLLTGTPATRPATHHLARHLVSDGQLRLRELSMLPAARGLSAGRIENLLAELPTAAAAHDHLHPRDAWFAADALAALGNPAAHQRAVSDAMARPDGHRVIENLGAGQQTGRLPTAGCTGLAHLDERTRAAADQRFNRLHGAPSGVDGLQLVVALPGHDHELTAAGTDMHNCLDRHATGGEFELREGAIILALRPTGRRDHAIQVDGNHRVTAWRGRRNAEPDLRQADRIAARLRMAGLRVPPTQELASLDGVPF